MLYYPKITIPSFVQSPNVKPLPGWPLKNSTDKNRLASGFSPASIPIRAK